MSTKNLVEENVEFNESEEARAYMGDMFSTFAYNKPMQAVIREYANNALDSMFGLYPEGEQPPVVIDLPSRENDYTLTISDSGCGMTLEETITNHGGFGFSTKQGNADYLGEMGYGSKSAYAVADMFTVNTVKDGMRSIVTYRNKSEGGKGRTVLFHGEAVNDDGSPASNGTEVSIIVRDQDTHRWAMAAEDILQWWDSKKTPVSVSVSTWYNCRVGKSWNRIKWYNENVGITSETGHQIIMGNVSYPLPDEYIDEMLPKGLLDRHWVLGTDDANIVLHVPNKSFTSLISRESLTFNEEARQTLFSYKDDILNAFHSLNQKSIDAMDVSKDKRCVLFGDITKDPKSYTYKGESIKLDVPLTSFRITHNRNNTRVEEEMYSNPYIFDVTKMNDKKLILVKNSLDIKERTLKSAVKHHISKCASVLDNTYEYDFVAISSPFDKTSWLKWMSWHVEIDAQEIVDDYKKHLNVKKKNTGGESKLTDKISTRTTFDKNETPVEMSIDEIAEACKLPLSDPRAKRMVYVVKSGEHSTVASPHYAWGMSSRRIVIHTAKAKVIHNKLIRAGITDAALANATDYQPAFDNRDVMISKEWANAEPIIRKMLGGDNPKAGMAVPYGYYNGYFQGAMRILNLILQTLSDSSHLDELKDSNMKKFCEALEDKRYMIQNIKCKSLSSHYMREYDDVRVVAWFCNLPLLHHISKMDQNVVHYDPGYDLEPIRHEIIKYINREKVKL